jgi:hypothetical protein
MAHATKFLDTQRLRLRPGSRALRARYVALGAAAVLAGSALSGCASQPKPTAQLVRATTLVSEAQRGGAERYAAADLQRARDELSDARNAESNHKYHDARRLADRAAADADLASARAASTKARKSAQEVRRSLDSLREQLQQSTAPAGDNGAGAGGSGQDQP